MKGRVGIGLCTLGTDDELVVGTLGTARGVVVCLVGTGVKWYEKDFRNCLSGNMSGEGMLYL